MNCSDANSNIKKQPNLACYSLWLVESRQFVTTRSEVFIWLDGILFPVRDTVISGIYRFLGWLLLHILLASHVREIKKTHHHTWPDMHAYWQIALPAWGCIFDSTILSLTRTGVSSILAVLTRVFMGPSTLLRNKCRYLAIFLLWNSSETCKNAGTEVYLLLNRYTSSRPVS